MEWGGIIDGIQQMAFYGAIYDFLDGAVNDFGVSLLNRAMQIVAGAALTALTIWLMIQGYRIVTGQSRESMAALISNSARAAFICACASGFALFGQDLSTFFKKDLGGQITELVTGDDTDARQQIDRNLGLMTVAMLAIDSVNETEGTELAGSKTQAKIMAGIGAGAPAVVAGSMLLLFQIAIAMFIGFGPIFILCLLFDQTKSLFQRWLFYGIGTLFSQAVLVFVTSIAMEMVARVGAVVWLRGVIDGPAGLDSQGITTQTLQQGGMGLILSTLILATPPMAAMFFQGALGNFSPYAGMGGQFNGAASPAHANGMAGSGGR